MTAHQRTIADNLAATKRQVQTACKAYQKDPTEVQLLAVSKCKPTTDILEAIHAGQTAFGENYLQEALEKITALSKYPLEWHFIGQIQSRKCQDIATHFDVVHSVDRVKIAERLSQFRRADQASLRVFLQVNIDQSPTKAGFMPEELLHVFPKLIKLESLKILGLMAIPDQSSCVEDQRKPFAALASLQSQLNEKFQAQLNALSMGMSDSLEAAIAEGSTMVRVGTQIFGKR